MAKRVSDPVIRLRGVRHNNLKNFDLDLPIGKLVVITGLSGSGKSSLAFDTLYAEGQRRYIETFSPYARQFFDRMDKPQVDRIEGIPPAIAIEQRNAVRTTRSTVGTMTELCDYLKLLWPHLAQLHCRGCGQPVHPEPPQMVWKRVNAEWRMTNDECLVTFDVPLSEKLSLADSLALVAKQGYQRLLVDDQIVRIEEAVGDLSFVIRHSSLTVVQDRVRLTDAHRARFTEACEQAYHFGKGKLAIHKLAPGENAKAGLANSKAFSKGLHCARCNLDYREPTPALFSFNHPLGACPTCKGFGRVIGIDYALALPDRSLTLAAGAVRPWRSGFSAECQDDLKKFCKIRGVPMDVPFRDLPARQQDWVMFGDPDYGKDDEHQWPRAWYGIKGYFGWLEGKSYKMHVRVLLSRYRSYTTCPDCRGRRLNPDALLYLVPTPADASKTTMLTLADFYALPIDSARHMIGQLAEQHAFDPEDPLALVLNDVHARLDYLVEVGLGYLTLDRPTRTLSGGETERVNLTTCLGTRLVNTLFVLDEPSVGLHPRDTARLVCILERLRDTGNTVVVVEHEAAVMRAADQVVDLGPGSGERGGHVIFQGPLRELLKSERSLTGQYLSGRKQIEIPARRAVHLECGDLSPLFPPDDLSPGASRQVATQQSADKSAHSKSTPAVLRITGATRHNLKDLDVEIPLGRFVCLTGVSGSGKTTLVRDVLLPALQERFQANAETVKTSDRMEAAEVESDDDAEGSTASTHSHRLTGHEHLANVVLVDQSPLGKTPRSNPAVYVGAFDHVRDLFAQTEEAKQRGLNASAFSFNSAQGQCERCRGAGFEKVEMQFLSDVFIRCPDCQGRRYREHILAMKLRGSISNSSVDWSIADLLEAPVDDAITFLLNFGHLTPAKRAIRSLLLLQEVGLGYLRLGQPINTLSGGESQRLKLASHLAQAAGSDSSIAGAGVEVVQTVNTREAAAQWLANRRAARGACALPVTTGVAASRQSAAILPGENLRRSPETPLRGTITPRGTLFLFDEPTTGLHFDDVRVLLRAFQRLVDAGHSVLVIEHNLEVIKCADWVIDLGPEAGQHGGRLVVAGTPETVAACEASHTGHFLRAILRGSDADAGASVAVTTKPLTKTMANDSIQILGAREHNLKNLALDIPRNRFVVVTGVSGSGKSTLAFDLLFAEGQRRFLDSMSTYARQFVEQLARPDVDLITGLPPTVSIEQRTTRGGGKSTVATVTEAYHFLRLLFARLGTQFCPDCQQPVQAQTRDELARGLCREAKKRGDLILLAPVVRNRKGFHSDVAEWAARHGYKEIRADGKIFETSKPFRLDRFKEHDVEIVVGVLDKRVGRGVPTAPPTHGRSKRRAEDSAPYPQRTPQQLIDDALKLGHGTLYTLDHVRRMTVHSTERSCPGCGKSYPQLDPKNFSYNSSQGWCPKCRGFGEIFYMPEDIDRGERADAIEETWWNWSEGKREVCSECHGARLRPEARAVRLIAASGEPVIDAFAQMSVAEACEYFCRLRFKGREATIACDILPEIVERLRFLDEVGLGYLALGRGVTTLSGGEAQRIRLAAQLGSNLSGVLYVLDEPTIGLHARDNVQLLAALTRLRTRGNSLVVVEHDEETMRAADYIIDLGPGAGVHGGQLVAGGTLRELMRHADSVTGQCLRAQEVKKYPSRGERRPVQMPNAECRMPKARRNATATNPSLVIGHSSFLSMHGASVHNLKDLTICFPLNRFVVVTGVSGSGKSTLVRDCLLPAMESVLKKAKTATRSPITDQPLPKLSGHESLKAVYEVDQSPIGRTPRSIPATYVGFFDEIRRLFSLTPEARLRGYSPSRFSFNSAQGRCPQCEGAGIIKLEMNFLPPAFVKCEACQGLRFNRETLDVEYGGKNIAQVLDMSVEEAIGFFAGIQKVKRPLEALHDTGLDYLKLGQTSPTLSGGEAQRVKLVTHLLTGLKPGFEAAAFRDAQTTIRHRNNLFILEEPTIGLHMNDVRRLVEVLQRLVDAGHSVIVIEHNLDFIAEADWVIDLGPEGGAAGGELVVAGTPEEVARNKRSHTGRFLRQLVAKTLRVTKR